MRAAASLAVGVVSAELLPTGCTQVLPDGILCVLTLNVHSQMVMFTMFIRGYSPSDPQAPGGHVCCEDTGCRKPRGSDGLHLTSQFMSVIGKGTRKRKPSLEDGGLGVEVLSVSGTAKGSVCPRRPVITAARLGQAIGLPASVPCHPLRGLSCGSRLPQARCPPSPPGKLESASPRPSAWVQICTRLLKRSFFK